jgi:hypothetical protein
MSRPKPKRNKKYQPRAVAIPMMAETRDELALALHAAVETLIHAPDVDTYNELSLRLVTLGRVVGPKQFLEAAKRAMMDVAERYGRVGKFGVKDDEAAALRLSAGAMDRALGLIPVNYLLAAEVKTMKMCEGHNL